MFLWELSVSVAKSIIYPNINLFCLAALILIENHHQCSKPIIVHWNLINQECRLRNLRLPSNMERCVYHEVGLHAVVWLWLYNSYTVCCLASYSCECGTCPCRSCEHSMVPAGARTPARPDTPPPPGVWGGGCTPPLSPNNTATVHNKLPSKA